MPLSYVSVPGGGSTAQHVFSVPYIEKEHVHVYIDGVSKAFTWVDDGTISITTPVAGDLLIRRETPYDEALAIFTAPVFRTADVNLASTHAFYLLQEFAEWRIPEATEDAFDALTFRVNGTVPSDVLQVLSPSGLWVDVVDMADLREPFDAIQAAAEVAQAAAETAQTGAEVAQAAAEVAEDNAVAATANKVTKSGDQMTGLLAFKAGENIAVAATLDLTQITSNNVNVTGTGTISSITGIASGTWMQLNFAGDVTLVHSTGLQLPDARDMVVHDNEHIIIRKSSTNVRVIAGNATSLSRAGIRRFAGTVSPEDMSDSDTVTAAHVQAAADAAGTDGRQMLLTQKYTMGSTALKLNDVTHQGLVIAGRGRKTGLSFSGVGSLRNEVAAIETLDGVSFSGDRTDNLDDVSLKNFAIDLTGDYSIGVRMFAATDWELNRLRFNHFAPRTIGWVADGFRRIGDFAVQEYGSWQHVLNNLRSQTFYAADGGTADRSSLWTTRHGVITGGLRSNISGSAGSTPVVGHRVRGNTSGATGILTHYDTTITVDNPYAVWIRPDLWNLNQFITGETIQDLDNAGTFTLDWADTSGSRDFGGANTIRVSNYHLLNMGYGITIIHGDDGQLNNNTNEQVLLPVYNACRTLERDTHLEPNTTNSFADMYRVELSSLTGRGYLIVGETLSYTGGTARVVAWMGNDKVAYLDLVSGVAPDTSLSFTGSSTADDAALTATVITKVTNRYVASIQDYSAHGSVVDSVHGDNFVEVLCDQCDVTGISTSSGKEILHRSSRFKAGVLGSGDRLFSSKGYLDAAPRFTLRQDGSADYGDGSRAQDVRGMMYVTKDLTDGVTPAAQAIWTSPTIGEGQSLIAKVYVNAMKSTTGANAAGYEIFVHAKRAVGSSLIINTQTAGTTSEITSTMDCVFDVSSNQLRLMGTGVASTTIRWMAVFPVYSVLVS